MKPNLVNIDRFKKKIRNLNTPNVTIPLAEAKALDADIDALLQYVIEVQNNALIQRENEVVQVEMDGGDF